MELFTLDSAFQPVDVVESYESLIWTERYFKNGDFEIKSNDISTLSQLLPIESYVALRESTVPMLVENHVIKKPTREKPVITITGRSFETVLERRGSVKSLPVGSVRQAWIMAASKSSDAAYLAMRTVLGDLAQYQDLQLVLPVMAPAVSALDAIPEISLTLPADYDTTAWSAAIGYKEGDIVGSGTTIYQATALGSNLNKAPATEPTYWTALYTGLPGLWGASELHEIKPADLYNTVMELLTVNGRGLKAVRPRPDGSQVGIEIYNGADLTAGDEAVVFDAKFDQFDDTTYLLSAQGSANVAYVYGSNGSSLVLKTAAPEPSGLSRRVLLLDQSSDGSVDTPEGRKSRGLVELYKYNATALFDGEVAQQVAEGFNRDYFLGDILKLVGEFGLSQNVRVAEFIRTSDATGEKAYPTFEAVS